jgi:hypothetical protein
MLGDLPLPPHQLTPEVHLRRAHGFFSLEMFEDVQIELRAVPDKMPWSKQKRSLLTFLYQELGEWHMMKSFAKSLRSEFPDEVDWWVSEAYATRRADSIEDARGILLDGLVLHGESAIIRYNLACYASLLSSPGECLDFLKEAVRRDEKYKKIALGDEDLKAVHQALIQMGWGKETD